MKQTQMENVTFQNNREPIEINTQELETVRNLVNDHLIKFLNTRNTHPVCRKFLQPAQNIFLSENAKRIRGVIPVLIARQLSLDLNIHLNYGSLVELLHFISLLHDDVIDGDNIRRGYPSLNNLFTNALAILIGDYFICEGLHLAINTRDELEVIKFTINIIKKLITGVILEEQFIESKPTLAAYQEMVRFKTGSLFSLSFGLPFLGEDNLDLAVECGALFGYLFQIYDDHLDRHIDQGPNNLYNFLEERAIDRTCQSTYNELMEKSGFLGIRPVVQLIVNYLKSVGYFHNINAPAVL